MIIVKCNNRKSVGGEERTESIKKGRNRMNMENRVGRGKNYRTMKYLSPNSII